MSLLSKDKAEELRGVLGLVKGDIARICRDLGVKRRTIYAVLDGESSDYDSLKKVVKEAKKLIRERGKESKALESL